MDVQSMKLQALKNAQDAKSDHGTVEIIGVGDKHKLVCSCYQLTKFSFGWFVKEITHWHPASLDVGEDFATGFLKALGH